MVQQIHYEVHVNKNGRWNISAHFKNSQMEAAIADGKRAEKLPGIKAVKVIRNIFNTQDGIHQEFLIYKSANLSYSKINRQKKSASSGDNQISNNSLNYAPNVPFELQEKVNSLSTVLIRLLIVLVFSLSIAGILTYVTSTIIRLLHNTSNFNFGLSKIAEVDILFITFCVTFLFSLAYVSFKFIRFTSADRNPIAVIEVGKSNKEHKKQEQLSNSYAKLKNEKDAAGKMASNFLYSKNSLHNKRKEIQKNQEVSDPITDNIETQETFSKEINIFEDQVKPATGEIESETIKIKKDIQLMHFLKSILTETNTDIKKLDNFNKFGINLFLAGASETWSQVSVLSADIKILSLTEVVHFMGFKKSHSETFSRKYEEYLLQDPRYMQMFQAGRNSMNTFFQDSVSAANQFRSALIDWNRPKQKEAHLGPVTVLFTDIAGSTAMTQAHGDERAQQVIRTHNRIIREALTDNFGKEIKHTGDGIMAAFSKTTNSVAAAIQMQRKAATYNKDNPDLLLHLKIGLNAGEPIAEDNDLFGSTVQMSARIVDKAQGEQIFVSENVRGICAGKGINFINRGGFEMKGFSEPPVLYEVEWRI